MFRKISFLAICLCLLIATDVHSQVYKKLTPQQFLEEIDVIVSSIKEIHPRPFQMISEADFLKNVEELKSKVTELTPGETVLEMMKIVASMQDGHSMLWPFTFEEGRVDLFPVRSYLFEDGWFILSTRKEDKQFVGGKILEIGGQPVEKVKNILYPYIATDNRFQKRDHLPQYIMLERIMAPLGLLDGRNRLNLTVECVDGTTRNLTLASVKDPLSSGVFDRKEQLPGELDGVTFRSSKEGDQPRYLRRSDENYWYEYLPGSNTIYFQFNAVQHKKSERFDVFIERLFDEYDEKKAQQLIIDLRHNGGGNNTILRPLIHSLIKRDQFQEPGNLTIITGRRTFSAAQCCAGWISKNVNPLFAGEPTGARLNFPGDSRRPTLPHSGLFLRISQYYWTNTWPWDNREAIFPSLPHEMTSAEYFSNNDVLLDKLLSGEKILSLADTLWEVAKKHQDPQAIVPVYHDYKNEYPDKWSTTETEINALGYRLMRSGNLEAAIVVFTLNTESYPDAFNTWDSLAESYMNKNDFESAIKYYQKSLDLNPDNTNARDMIQKMKAEGKKTH